MPSSQRPTARPVVDPVATPASAVPTGRPLTLASLAQIARARMLEHDVGPQHSILRLVPVHGRQGHWLVLRARGQTPSLAALRPAVPADSLDLSLRVDLLLRWIDPSPPAAGPAGATDVNRVAPLALLLERHGPLELSDGDFGWWRAFRMAAGVVGRRAVTAWLVCPPGVGEISDHEQTWPRAS